MEASPPGQEPDLEKDPKPKRRWVKGLISVCMTIIRAMNDVYRFVSTFGDMFIQ